MRPIVVIFAVLLGLWCSSQPAVCAPPAPAGRITVYTSWTMSGLNVAFRVDDPLVVGNQSMPLGRPWHDDAVAVYLDFDPANGDDIGDDCVRVVISAAGGATVQRGLHGEWQDEPDWFQLSSSGTGTIRYGVNVTGTINDSAENDEGYLVEMALAWKLLKVQPPFVSRTSDTLPAIGFAVVNYSQGETQSASCWPTELTEEGLSHPARWGRLQFLQTMQPQATVGNLVSATLMHGSPLIDGNVRGEEWFMAGSVNFPRTLGQDAPVIAIGRRDIGLLAAWYVLDPQPPGAVEQAIEPISAVNGPATPMYHLQQIRDARRAGVDIFAVEVPVDAAERARLQPRLAALVDAMATYDTASSATYLRDYPLLMPAVTAGGVPDVTAAAFEETLRDFYALVPVQYRAMLPTDTQQFYSPVIMEGFALPEAALDSVNSALSPVVDTALGWMPDTTTAALPKGKALAQCVWDAKVGVQMSHAGMVTAMIAPGVATAKRDLLPRRGGEIYDNGWLTVSSAKPELVVVRSWNDFQDGTAIAPSRQYGYQYADATRLHANRLADGQKFAVRVLRHNLPPVLRPGAEYPVDLLIKNGSVTKMVTRDGFRVDYQIVQNGNLLRSGTATQEIALLDFATARIQFTLPTSLDTRTPLSAGTYELRLDFNRNKLPYLTAPLMVKTLGTIAIPFTVGRVDTSAQVIAAAVPPFVAAGISSPVTIRVRNQGGKVWTKKRTKLTWQWVDATGTALGEPRQLVCPGEIASGGITEFRGELPAAPLQPGWYRVQATLTESPDGTPLYVALAQVETADVHAQFVGIDLPGEWPDSLASKSVSVLVRNVGGTVWTPTLTALTYQWMTWDGQPIPGATGNAAVTEHVAAGKATLINVEVVPPPGGGALRCAFSIVHDGHTALLHAHPVQPVSAVPTVMLRPGRFIPVDVQAACNGWAAHDDTVAMKADLDGQGNAFPMEEFLPDMTNPPAGFKPNYFMGGSTPDAPSFRFALPRSGRAPVIHAVGQAIALPVGTADAVHLAALTTGNSGPVVLKVRYQDGGETVLTVPMSSWMDGAAFDEPTMLTTRHLHTRGGDQWYLRGSVYAYRIPLDPTRAAAALVLPDYREVCIFAVTVEHVGL